MTPGVALLVVGLAGTLYADKTDADALRRICKPLASLGFLWVAFFGAVPRPPLSLLHAGLASSAIGDAMLLGRSRRALMLGLTAFALTHVLYTTHFTHLAISDPGNSTVVVGIAAFGILMAVGHRVWKWLEPHVGSMRVPVRVYALLVSLMAASAITSGTVPGATLWLAPLGALMFFISDLSVARDRFVRHGFPNKAWGLPLYYSGQLLIAILASNAL